MLPKKLLYTYSVELGIVPTSGMVVKWITSLRGQRQGLSNGLVPLQILSSNRKISILTTIVANVHRLILRKYLRTWWDARMSYKSYATIRVLHAQWRHEARIRV